MIGQGIALWVGVQGSPVGFDLPPVAATAVFWALVAMGTALWVALIFVPLSIRRLIANHCQRQEQMQDVAYKMLKAIEKSVSYEKGVAEGLFVLNKQLEEQMIAAKKSRAAPTRAAAQ